jgi:UDP-2,3-diacylglucosamine pyrophosphatase LpxH
MTLKPITRVQRNVHVIELQEKQEFLLISDVHWDNPKCNRELLISHLEDAKKRNAIILINGDFLCLMQGRFDPRGSKKDVRPEHNKGNYLDLVIEDAADFLAPYAKHIAVIGYGNHETSIIKRLETDPLQRMVDLINYKANTQVQTGGYGGWVVCKFKNKRGACSSYKIKYFHGSGGGGPVTKNTIGHQRLDAMIDSADLIWVGHTHDLWSMSVEVETLSHTYNTKLRTVTHVQTAAYKDEYADGNGGWHIERGAPPKPLGGYWLTLDPVELKHDAGRYLKIHAETVKTRH